MDSSGYYAVAPQWQTPALHQEACQAVQEVCLEDSTLAVCQEEEEEAHKPSTSRQAVPAAEASISATQKTYSPISSDNQAEAWTTTWAGSRAWAVDSVDLEVCLKLREEEAAGDRRGSMM